MHGRGAGMALAALAAVFASTAGVLLRHVESADAWTILFFRSLGFTVTLTLFAVVRHRRETPALLRELSWLDGFIALTQAGAFIAFVLALVQTNVATVVAVLAVAPMIAGLLGWIALGERPSALAWLAMLTAFSGVAFVVRGGIDSGAGRGLVLAALACVGYSAALVGLRAGRRRDRTSALCLSGALACAVSFLMSDGLDVTRSDLIIGLLLGTVQIGGQYILLSTAARFAAAADIALVMVLEVILAPLWVWLFVGEAVPTVVLYGGSVIAAALVLNAAVPATVAGRRSPLQAS